MAPRSDSNFLSEGLVGNVLLKTIAMRDDSCYWPAVRQFYGIIAVGNGLGPFPLMEQEMDVMDVLTSATGPPFAVLNSNHDQLLAWNEGP